MAQKHLTSLVPVAATVMVTTIMVTTITVTGVDITTAGAIITTAITTITTAIGAGVIITTVITAIGDTTVTGVTTKSGPKTLRWAILARFRSMNSHHNWVLGWVLGRMSVVPSRGRITSRRQDWSPTWLRRVGSNRRATEYCKPARLPQ